MCEHSYTNFLIDIDTHFLLGKCLEQAVRSQGSCVFNISGEARFLEYLCQLSTSNV